ncbi:hypothetical protein TNIN_69481 [Trichonephila inaurata madagascariensis]|uniref:Uncharacterized protein n=1 Tax=Trichonephila inaurata madagascariensis TaxID=2747483 RepID=A0A8X6JXI8_9ARAC|nr:hypothetical protein TNIN_69481 [Trichonephila inaurata madagascariensis]
MSRRSNGHVRLQAWKEIWQTWNFLENNYQNEGPSDYFDDEINSRRIFQRFPPVYQKDHSLPNEFRFHYLEDLCNYWWKSPYRWDLNYKNVL